MAVLQVIYGYQPIFKQKAKNVENVDSEIKQMAQDMFDTMYYERAVGLGANMVGLLKRIVVADLFENKVSNPICLVNPEIIWKSEEMQTVEEASLSFPGVFAPISRPKSIKISYLNLDNKKEELEAEGFLSSVLQHEIDYLDGVTIFDHMSKMKRDLMMKKMEKQIKAHPPHQHSSSCRH